MYTEPETDGIERSAISFQDIALAAVFIYAGHELQVDPPDDPRDQVTFSVTRTEETKQLTEDFVTSSRPVDPRRFYDALGVAKRLLHRAKAGAR